MIPLAVWGAGCVAGSTVCMAMAFAASDNDRPGRWMLAVIAANAAVCFTGGVILWQAIA